MTKEFEKEIEQLYKLLQIDTDSEDSTEQRIEISGERKDNFFEKRWDSSFFSNIARY